MTERSNQLAGATWEIADKQGDLSDNARVEAALNSFVRDTSFATATYMESCIHCGLCAEVCQFYTTTGDPKYTPIWKLEPFKQAYKREIGPFWFIYKALGLKRRVTIDELESWQHLLYDTCNLCGRCSMVCPMGIDISSLIGVARRGMYRAGLVPDELMALEGTTPHLNPEVFAACIKQLEQDYDIKLPVDLEQADVLLTISAVEVLKYPKALVDLARILNHMGYSWTYRSEGYEATSLGALSGDTDWQAAMNMKLIQAATDCKAKLIVLPECGHAYSELRWHAANAYGKALPFRILHITELLAEGVENGSLRTTRAAGSVTFHDPCAVSRVGGATAAPRKVLKALGVDLHELPGGGDMNWCCGGGGGVASIHRADELRHKAFQVKIEQVEQSGADKLYTSCSTCRQTFEDGGKHFDWDRKADSLVELVAEHLAD